MTLKSGLKSQLNAISQRVAKAEKMAEKQVRTALKSTEQFRTHQLKNVQHLIKRARTLKQHQLVKNAEKLTKDLETRASAGLHLLFTKLNVPTRYDLERLSKRVSQLQKRLDDIEKTKGSRSTHKEG